MNRAAARARRRAARALTIAPAIAYLAVDVVNRARPYPAMFGADAIALIATWTMSALVWSMAITAIARRHGVVRWLACGAIAVWGAVAALQVGAFTTFGTYIDYDVLRSAVRLDGIGSLARPFISSIAGWTLPAALASIAWALGVKRIAPSRRSSGKLAAFGLPLVITLALFSASYIPHRALDASPDVMAFGAVGRFAIERPAPLVFASTQFRKQISFVRTPSSLPRATPTHARNVLLVLTESVRASAVCSAFGSDCPHNPFSNALLPDRLPLERMRAVDSFTLLSFGVIFSGLPVNAPKREWLTAPLLFDYAHAGGIATAYWSAQHPAFAGSHAWTDGEPIDRLAWATDFDAHADEALGADDDVVVDRAIAELPTLGEPYFAVVHDSGTHYPYRIDDDAPFQPTSTTLERSNPAPLRNRYYDAIYRQDKSTAKLLRALRTMPAYERTVVVFVSDHGESFYEHDMVLHGSSLWDEELRVPAWIDAPKGTLTNEERASLASLRDVSVTEVDLAPTILDLLGLYEDVTSKMAGASLLRSPPPSRSTTISTCNDLWSCFVPSWGKLKGDKKWLTHPLDPTFRCFDTREDPAERHDLGPAACGEQ